MRVAPVLVLTLLVVAIPPAHARGAASVGCAEHIEGPGVSPEVDPSRDVVRGAMTLMGARLLQHHRMPVDRRTKLAIMLEAGHDATIVVAPGARRIARLEYAFDSDARRPDVAVDFRPCEPDEPRFSGPGTVGPRTIWAGGMEVRRPACVRLLVWVDRVRLEDVRIPLGRPCRPRTAQMPSPGRNSFVNARWTIAPFFRSPCSCIQWANASQSRGSIQP